MKKIFTLYIIALCFALSCKDNGTEAAPEEKPEEVVGGSVSTNLDNALLLKLVNQQRLAGCNCGATVMPGVPALTWNEKLAQAALNHSKDMNESGFFSHTSSDGKTLSERFNAVGYNWRAIAENIASGQKDEQTVFSSWIKSEGHCKNIMSASYKEMGAARAGSYWTQDFGTQTAN